MKVEKVFKKTRPRLATWLRFVSEFYQKLWHWKCFPLDSQLICNHGMQSTIQSLNQVLDPVTNTTCQPSEVCGVVTLTIKFDRKTGESKIGGCAHISNCSSTTGCQLAIANLLCGIWSEECKVLYILNNQFFTCFILHCIKYPSFIEFPGVQMLWKRRVSAEYCALRLKLCRNCAFQKNFSTKKLI